MENDCVQAKMERKQSAPLHQCKIVNRRFGDISYHPQDTNLLYRVTIKSRKETDYTA